MKMKMLSRYFHMMMKGISMEELQMLKKTIETLNLDCSTIVHRRKAAFEAYSSLGSASDIEWASEIARLKGRNKDNQYEEYCFAVIYFIEHYLAI